MKNKINMRGKKAKFYFLNWGFFFSLFHFFLFGYTFQLYCSIIVYFYFKIIFSKFFSAHSVSYS